MLHIIVIILKIIGIVLLCILGLLLFILLSVLFVPARYRLTASYYQQLKAGAKVSWFFHLIYLSAVYENEKLTYKIRICGYVWKGSEKKSPEKLVKDVGAVAKAGVEEANDDNVGSTVTISSNDDSNPISNYKDSNNSDNDSTHRDRNNHNSHSNSDNHNNHSDSNNYNSYNDHNNSYTSEADQNNNCSNYKDKSFSCDNNDNSTHTIMNRQSDKLKKPKFSFRKIYNKIVVIVKNIVSKIRDFWNSILKFLKAIRDKTVDAKTAVMEKYTKVTEFINDEENRVMFGFLKIQSGLVLKHLKPTKYKIHVKAGVDEPDVMGKILAIVAMTNAFLNLKFDFQPVFDENIFEGDILLKGRLRVYTLGRIALRVYRNKQFRKLIKK